MRISYRLWLYPRPAEARFRGNKKWGFRFPIFFNSYVFFYFKSYSYVLYCLSDEKVIISKIIVEILKKSNSYVFFYLKWDSYVFYYFKHNSYVFFYFKSNSYVLKLFKWWKVRISKPFLKFCWNRILMFCFI